MTSVNSVSGSGQEDLSTQLTNLAPESSDTDVSNDVESNGSEIEMSSGINPETAPNDYADGSAQGQESNGFEALDNSDAENAQKEVNENTSKVLSQMEKIYLGQETGAEPLGEATGKSDAKSS